MIEKKFVRIERISDNLLIMGSDKLTDISKIMKKLQDNFRRLDTK